MNQDVQHSILRRCDQWDYSQPAIYLITLVLADRSSRALGRIAVDQVKEGMPVAAHCEVTALGKAVLRCWQAIADFHPQVQLIASQVMPDHFHGLLWVKRPLKHHLGQVIRGFKIGCTQAAGAPLFAEGFQDKILFSEHQLERMSHYLAENPLRLAVKRANQHYFTLAQDLEMVCGERGTGHFSALGNRYLLQQPMIQVQCSRRWFAYQRTVKAGGGKKIVRNAQGEPLPACVTADYQRLREHFFSCAQKGRVLLSPCVSDGEREIAREALVAGLPLITLQNKGFAPLQKPSGRYFEACAAGKLLMLAPKKWPYLPGNKPMTRTDALILNRLCQWIAGEGAAEIHYKGMCPANLDRLACDAALIPAD